MEDLSGPPPGHPDRLIAIAGVRVFLGGGTPDGLVFPEHIQAGDVPAALREVRERLGSEGRRRGAWFVPEVARPAGLATQLQELRLS